MQDYLKKYLDVPSKTKKTNESKVVYRSQVSVIDNDNFDVTMGRLVDGMEDEFDYKPVFVETNESRKLDVNQKQQILSRLNQIKVRSRSNSKSKEKKKANQSDSSDSSDSTDSEDDSASNMVIPNRQTIYRDNQTGNQISLDDKLKQEQENIKLKREQLGKAVQNQRAQEENEKRLKEWSKGLVQQKEQKDRYEFKGGDEMRERDLFYISKEQFADPMRNIIKQDENDQLNKTMKLVKKCKFPSIPNRFGIEAGHRWDGVDRGNGYERKYMASQNERQDNYNKQQLEHIKQL